MLLYFGEWSCESFRFVRLIGMTLSRSKITLVWWITVDIDVHIGEICYLYIVVCLVRLLFVEIQLTDPPVFHSFLMLRLSMSIFRSDFIVFIRSFLPIEFGRIECALIVDCRGQFHEIENRSLKQYPFLSLWTPLLLLLLLYLGYHSCSCCYYWCCCPRTCFYHYCLYFLQLLLLFLLLLLLFPLLMNIVPAATVLLL